LYRLSRSRNGLAIICSIGKGVMELDKRLPISQRFFIKNPCEEKNSGKKEIHENNLQKLESKFQPF